MYELFSLILLLKVHIVKKIPKWKCKVCNEKQSVRKVFANGTGKDCRLVVQQLNLQRSTCTNEVQEPNTSVVPAQNSSTQNRSPGSSSLVQSKSKWSEFLTSSLEKENGHCIQDDEDPISNKEPKSHEYPQYDSELKYDENPKQKRQHNPSDLSGDSNEAKKPKVSATSSNSVSNKTHPCHSKTAKQLNNVFESEEDYDLDALLDL